MLFSNPTTEEKAIYANQNKEEYSMANYVTITSDKRKKTALLLCVFLGMFGHISIMSERLERVFYIPVLLDCSASDGLLISLK